MAEGFRVFVVRVPGMADGWEIVVWRGICKLASPRGTEDGGLVGALCRSVA